MIDIHFSREAKKQITAIVDESAELIVPALVWGIADDMGAGWWEVGFYRRAKVDARDLVVVDDIELAIAGPPLYLKQLEGKTIDVVDGQFVFV